MHPSRRVVSLAACAVLIGSLVVVSSSPASADCVSAVSTEQEVAVIAAECGDRVEILDGRTPFDQMFAEPDGTVTIESAVEPQPVQRDDGSWADVDPALSMGSDGRFAPIASLADVTFSAGGTDPLVHAAGEDGSSRCIRAS